MREVHLYMLDVEIYSRCKTTEDFRVVVGLERRLNLSIQMFTDELRMGNLEFMSDKFYRED